MCVCDHFLGPMKASEYFHQAAWNLLQIQPSMVPPTPPTPREPREPRGEPRGGGEPESRVPVKIRLLERNMGGW